MQYYINSKRNKKNKKVTCYVLVLCFLYLDICRITNSPYEQDEASEIIIDYEHEWPVKANSRRDGEVQQDVGSPPFF